MPRSRTISETSEPQLWLLLVGVSKYQDNLLQSLPYAVEDCQGLEKAFKESAMRFGQLKLIVHISSFPQMPQLATVRASLKQVVESAKSQDTVLFYFSGHGMLDADSQQAFLCLTDTQTDNLLDTGLGVQELLQILGACKAIQQLIVLDACHSGGLTLKGVDSRFNPSTQIVEALQQKGNKNQGFYALLSCDKGQRSWEFPELGHGLFTYYLIRGLRGEAADAKGEIEVKGLYKYIYHRTLEYIDKLNRQRRLINQQKCSRGETDALHPEYPLQTPKLIVEAVGELILGEKITAADSQLLRKALVVEGLSEGWATLELSKVLSGAGGFSLTYWHPDARNLPDIREAIQDCLRRDNQEQATALLYLRGRIEETATGEALLVLDGGNKISRSWLRQQLRQSELVVQIVVLDCPGAKSMEDWVEDLQLESQYSQCLIAGAAGRENPEEFTRALLKALAAPKSQVGFSVAEWIAELQFELAETDVWWDFWLGDARGVIEVLPAPIKQKSISVDVGLCPYMGLKAFAEKDARYFYGREKLTQRLINQISQQSFLAVVGASGSGKSSVVQAGLMAQLRQGKHLPESEQWLIKCFRPGENPLQNLILALVEAGAEEETTRQQLELEGLLHLGGEGFVQWLRTRSYPTIVLVVDQFEELFTLAAEGARQSFLDIVLEAIDYAADRFKLVITLRADFIDACLEIPLLAQKLQQSNLLVPPRLAEDDYCQVIEKPAEQVGLKVETGLVELLLQELNRSVADLPLLEFVLEQLWEHRDKQAGQLTLQAYKKNIGGLKGALSRQANAVYESLDESEKVVAKWIFLSLTQLGEGSEDARRLVRHSELFNGKYPAASVEKTLQKFVAAKLIVVNQESDESGGGQSRGVDEVSRELEVEVEVLKREVTVEVAHEILIRNWSTLRWWVSENRSRLRQQQQIEKKASEWVTRGKHPDFLLQRAQLTSAEKFYQNYGDYLKPLEREYISASKKARRNTRIKIGGAFAVSLSLIVTSGIVAWQQRQQSQLANLIRYASFNIITPDIAQSISLSLPTLLETARATRQAGDIDKALDDYRQILSMTNKVQHKIRKTPNITLTLKTAENSLSEIIRQERLPGLEVELKAGKFGKLVSPDFSLFENQYAGALRLSYAILMREAGAKADMNNDGYLTEGEEVALPCQTLKDIEQLWRKYTKNRCGWYAACRELSGKTLAAMLSFPPSIPLVESRLQQCQSILDFRF